MAQIGLHLSYEFLNLAKRFCLTLHLFTQNDQVRIPPFFTSDTTRTILLFSQYSTWFTLFHQRRQTKQVLPTKSADK